jgi:hypothetical protein
MVPWVSEAFRLEIDCTNRNNCKYVLVFWWLPDSSLLKNYFYFAYFEYFTVNLKSQT